MPDRLTLLDDTHRGLLCAYGIYYQEGVVQRAFPLHWHTFYELELVVGGRGTQWINGHAMALSPGVFYLLSPTDLHRLHADAMLTVLSVKLPEDLLADRVEKLLHIYDAPVTALLHGEGYEICHSDFLRLKALLSNPSPYGGERVAALVTLLLTALYSSAGSGQSFRPGMAFQRQHAVLKYIHENYLKQIPLKEIASVAGLTPNHFCTQFSKVAGCSFVEYHTRLRIQHACTLLTETRMSVTEIAFASGFGSISHFLRTFHKQKQTTPSTYRCAEKL